MKAIVKATGEFVDVHNTSSYPNIWFGAEEPYETSELEFISTSKVKSDYLEFLAHFTNQELKDELKRRDKERQAKYPQGVHCRDCKHCGEGYTYKHQINKTMVCFVKPKPKMAPNCFYATSLSCKACDKFEIK